MPEEFGVGEARADDFFVAFAHGGGVLAFEVGDGDKVRLDFAAGTDDGAGFLVVLHGGDEDFLRDGEVAFVEAAADGDRPFGEAGVLYQQGFGQDGASAERGGFFFDLLADAFHAFAVAGDDVRGAQVGFVACGTLDADGFGVVDAVPEGVAASADAEVVKRQDAFVSECHEGQHGADEALFVVAPAHSFGDGQVVADVAEEFGQQGFQRLSRLFTVVGQPGAFAGFFDAEVACFDAAACREAECGFCPVTVFVFGGGQRRAFALDFLVGLFFCEVVDAPGEAARGGKGVDVAVGESGVAEGLGPQVASGGGEGGDGFGRQFFDADFDQQGGGHAAAPWLRQSGKPRASRSL